MGKGQKHGTEISEIAHEVSMRDHMPHGEILEREGTYPYNRTGLPEADPRELYKKGHQFCSPSVPAETLRLFLDELRKEYKRRPDEMGFGRVIWEGKAGSAMGSSKKEVYSLDCKNITNYVYDTENSSCIFKREMKLGKKVFKELLKDLNGESGFSDYMVLLSLFESQKHYDSAKASPGYKPKVKIFVSEAYYMPKEWKRNY
jgi:hypothetical protein